MIIFNSISRTDLLSFAKINPFQKAIKQFLVIESDGNFANLVTTYPWMETMYQII